jgi:hypothetical protein
LSRRSKALEDNAGISENAFVKMDHFEHDHDHNTSSGKTSIWTGGR